MVKLALTIVGYFGKLADLQFFDCLIKLFSFNKMVFDGQNDVFIA